VNIRRKLLTALLFMVICNVGHSTNQSSISFVPGKYSVKSELVMPHLEENLRYATTSEQHCLSQQKASFFFPILKHVSFTDCVLTAKESESAVFDLTCINPEAATGTARFVISEKLFRATLDIKMGGKNMKFSQRTSGQRIGPC